MKLNGKARLVVLIALVVLLASSNTLLLMQLAREKKDFEAFLTAREAVASILNEKLTTPPEGTRWVAMPGGTTTLQYSGRGATLLGMYPTSKHVRATARSRQWHHCWNFTAVLGNDDMAAPRDKKDSSLAWRADKISDWLLSDLAKAGFSCGLSCTQGTEGPTQLAQQFWWTEDFTIYVISETTVDLKAKTAKLSLTIIESF